MYKTKQSLSLQGICPEGVRGTHENVSENISERQGADICGAGLGKDTFSIEGNQEHVCINY